MENVVEVKNLKKSFNGKDAVQDVSFSIKKGEVVAILGPNGAGKTTTISIILGLLFPTSGVVKLFEKDPKDSSNLQRIGVMLQEVSVMDSLKVKEIIQLVRSYYDHPLSYEKIITLSGLSNEDLSKRTEKLSGGQKRKVNFALAIAGNPELLFLDEPTVGMDVSARKRFWETVNELAKKGKTVIFTTHYLQEADDFAKRILLINKGELVAEGTPDEIKGKISKQFVSFVPVSHFPMELFMEMPEVSDVVLKENRIFIYTEDSYKVLEHIFDKKIVVKDIQVDRGRLEEAFEEITLQSKETALIS